LLPGNAPPVRILFEYLAGGSTVEEFVDAFDAPRDKVEGVLKLSAPEIERGVSSPGGAQAA
jgi:hypothetical protein